MNDDVLKTSVDDLYELVKSRKKIAVEDAAKILKLPITIVQSLVDFLVEEKIFGMEYKFTTPYIYISEKKKINVEVSPPQEKKVITKEEFYQKATGWNVSSEKINELWKKYIKENMDYIKEVFYTKASSKDIQKEKIDRLWEKYRTQLQ